MIGQVPENCETPIETRKNRMFFVLRRGDREAEE